MAVGAWVHPEQGPCEGSRDLRMAHSSVGTAVGELWTQLPASMFFTHGNSEIIDVCCFPLRILGTICYAAIAN